MASKITNRKVGGASPTSTHTNVGGRFHGTHTSVRRGLAGGYRAKGAVAYAGTNPGHRSRVR
jgi:hypothetical protein